MSHCQLLIHSVGAASAYAPDAAHSFAAARAGVSRLSELHALKLYDPTVNTTIPVRGMVASCVADGFSGYARWLRLVTAAIRDCMASLEPLNAPTPLLVLLPDGYYFNRVGELEDGPPEDGIHPIDEWLEWTATYASEHLLDAVERECHYGFCPTRSQIHFGDTASFTELLGIAESMLEDGPSRRVLVGAVGSLIDGPSLQALDSLGVLKTNARAAGLVPGESSSFLALAREPRQGSRFAIKYVASASDSIDRFSGQHTDATALSGCIRDALVAAGPATWWIGNLNGDPYQSHAWGKASVALQDAIDWEESNHWFGGYVFGEVGPATIPMLLSWGIHATIRGYAPAEDCLVWASAYNGTSACLVAEFQRGES